MPRHLDDVSDAKRQRDESVSPNPDMSAVMRVAVAGTGGLARLIAHFIDEETSHHVVFLSRTVRPLIMRNKSVPSTLLLVR